MPASSSSSAASSTSTPSSSAAVPPARVSTTAMAKMKIPDFELAVIRMSPRQLVKVRDVARADENAEAEAIVSRELKSRVKDILTEENAKEFAVLLGLESRFTTLNRIGRKMAEEGDERRLRAVNTRLQELAAGGVLKTRRRKEGTGELQEQELEYKDTPTNRKLDRVGKTYKRVYYKDAEYEEVQRRVRRRKIRRKDDDDAGADGDAEDNGGKAKKQKDKTKKKRSTNLWIDSVAQAKKELDAPRFLIVRREAPDPSNEVQVLGAKVYKRAMEIMAVSKEKAAAAEAAASQTKKK